MAIVQPSPGLAECTHTRVDPIERLNTSLPVFLGRCDDGPDIEAILIKNWSEFRFHFGNENTVLSRAVYGYFDNGGGECYVLNWGEEPIPAAEKWRLVFKELDCVDDISLIAAPGVWSEDYVEKVLEHCTIRQDRLALLDLPKDFDPDEDGALPRSKFAVAYTPWIEIRDHEADQLVQQPPSGHIAGIYARVEKQRGIHCPPANEMIQGAVGACSRFSKGQRATLIESGVNLIRQNRRRGGDLRVWGAKTLSDDLVWQSLATRRLMLMLEAAIGEGTNWVVHRRNDESLWSALENQVTTFLEGLREEGLLVGNGPGDSYYVKCDAELNPVESIGGDQVIFEVGVCPHKANDFVIFRICQWAGGVDIAE